MRIALDARMAGYTSGGIAQYVAGLAEALASSLSPRELSLLESRWRPGLNVHGLRSHKLFTPPHHRLEQYILPLELASLRIDLLHSPDFIPPFRRRCKSVITVHDLGFLLYPETMTPRSLSYYSQVGRAVQSADHIIAVSRNTAQDLETWLRVPPDRITVIYEAASQRFRPCPDPEAALRARYQYGMGKPYLLFVGTLEPRKNLPTLLKALAAVRRQADVRLVVAGPVGWLADPIFQAVEELDLREHVSLLGAVSQQQLLSVYWGAEILVLPSLYEGFGLPPLEAMACGVPVIASNCSSIPEVLGDAGALVDPLDHLALAEEILKVLTDTRHRDAMIQAGQKRARRFDWTTVGSETLEVYRRVLEGR